MQPTMVGESRKPEMPAHGIGEELGALRPHIGPSPLAGYEHMKGFGVFALPFDSGHVLAMRVFPDNDFAPYVTVWHRTPEGHWRIYYDAARADIACPRYYGAAAERVAPANIVLRWTGPMELHVTMDAPRLDWTIDVGAPLRSRVLGAMGTKLPRMMWRSRLVQRLITRVGDAAFGVGDVTLSGRAPNGQRAFLMPERMFPIVESTALLEGRSLGRPTHADESPRIGDMKLPASPVLAIGEAYFSIDDPEEHRRTVEALQS
ncbi:hypothetical protein [Sandaracinus amylolyticus]|uniref:hypothetical protein n=1 Tax=Sandaracinus amylolyticus TaxID=927083 RepID=UPI001F31BE7B|nr:hypothetical protein [Sandaracinus amylolyticus]UJR84566.1 Hypothetical protein I5071_66450 [Sandaracinus amylolyticus]